jgi:tRNA(Arg) A34 adenosine deaminase TadA
MLPDSAVTENELTAYVREAVRISREHVAKGGIPFAGVVVRGGQVLGTGVNRVREDNDPTAHAEVVALRAAAAEHGLRATAGSTLIASGEPCGLCYLAARYFGVGRVVYAADRVTAARHGFDYAGSYAVFAEDPAAWRIEVTSHPVPEAVKPFEEYLAMDRRRT